jgi:hypothetical protein
MKQTVLRASLGILYGWLSLAVSAAPAAAQSAPGAGAWQPGPAGTGDHAALAGVIDSPSSGANVSPGTLALRGWFVDLTAQGWTGVDDVEIFLGTMDSGRPLGHAQFQQSRPDVASALRNPFWANAGWSANVPSTSLATGENTLSVYAHTPAKGWWLRQVRINLQPPPPPARGASRAIAPSPSTPSPIGNDISFPQCPTGAEPALQAFGIVGVTGGKPFTSNPCLVRQFVWALSSTSPTQPHVGLYMNTANPGPDVSPNLPPAGTVTPRACDGSWSGDCAYDYGWRSAQDAFGRAVGITGASAAAQYPWWLDVEAANSWSPQTDVNAAAVQGAIDFLHSMNIASVGIYSTSADWEALIGPPATNGPFGALPNWRPGASGVKDAPEWCSRTVSGGRVKYVQFTTGGFDSDFACF